MLKFTLNLTLKKIIEAQSWYLHSSIALGHRRTLHVSVPIRIINNEHACKMILYKTIWSSLASPTLSGS
jgi:hypothetical protein